MSGMDPGAHRGGRKARREAARSRRWWPKVLTVVVLGLVAVLATVGLARLHPAAGNDASSLTPLNPRTGTGTTGAAAGAGVPTATTTQAAAPTRTPAAPTTTPPTTTKPRFATQVTYTYSVASRGPVRTTPATVALLAKDVYADPRGWSLGGRISFRQVPSGGDFTLVIATPDQVQATGGVCDSTYSCRNGRLVLINEARWLGGSPTGVLRSDLLEYRKMVINHETGHWLGLHHRSCPGAGQPAPLMQQQSIALNGCKPNAWPTAPEIALVAQLHLS
jgi:Protein of unknown function (DUF3152)